MNQDLALNTNVSPEEAEKIASNHQYWESNASRFDISHEVSWGDINMMQLEIDTILPFINDGEKVLDAGCSNGFSTFEIAQKKDITVKAFDYSKKSIDSATKAQPTKDPNNKIEFYHCNILNIEEPDNHFDTAYSIRVIINLLSWELQQKALLEMHRVLKPGGLYLMSEAFIGSLDKLNQLRALAELTPLTVHDFNLYLEEQKFEDFISQYFEIVEVKKFSSIYYVASRFLRYLTMNNDDQDSFSNPINDFFAKYKETDNSNDFGIQKLYVLRKKG